jgi:hypothetical protein
VDRGEPGIERRRRRGRPPGLQGLLVPILLEHPRLDRDGLDGVPQTPIEATAHDQGAQERGGHPGRLRDGLVPVLLEVQFVPVVLARPRAGGSLEEELLALGLRRQGRGRRGRRRFGLAEGLEGQRTRADVVPDGREGVGGQLVEFERERPADVLAVFGVRHLRGQRGRGQWRTDFWFLVGAREPHETRGGGHRGLARRGARGRIDRRHGRHGAEEFVHEPRRLRGQETLGGVGPGGLVVEGRLGGPRR